MNKESVLKILGKHKLERLKAGKARDAAVLIPLVNDSGGELSVLFEIRNRSIVQGGEICFPGGRIETGESPETAVIRETCEELMLKPEDVDIIAPMFVMNGISDSLLYSYLGSIPDYQNSFSKDEVEEVFTVSIDKLLSMKPKQSTADFVFGKPDDFHYELVPGGRDYHWAKRTKQYYFYETEHGVIWGITGEILYNFLEKLR